MTPYVKIWGKWSNNFFTKSLKIISDRFMDIIFFKNVINGVNFVKIGHFVRVFLYSLVKMSIPRRYFRNDVPFFGSLNIFDEMFGFLTSLGITTFN